ncbi:MAG: YdbH domain-containing protein [Pseudomonadota bacterium]
MIRWIGRLFGGLVLLIMVLAVAAFFARVPILETVLARALINAGYQDVSVDARSLTLTNIAFDKISLKASDPVANIAATGITVTFDPKELVSARQVEDISIAGMSVSVDANEVISDMMPTDNARAEKAVDFNFDDLPFRSFVLQEGTLIVRERNTVLTEADINGRLDRENGGAFSVASSGNNFDLGGVKVSRQDINLNTTFSADGTATLEGAVSGDIVSEAASLEMIRLGIDGEMTSWRDLISGNDTAPKFLVQLDLKSGRFKTAQQTIADLDLELVDFTDEGRVFFDIDAHLEVAGDGDGFSVSVVDSAPVTFTGGDGQLLVTPTDGSRFFRQSANEREFGARFDVGQITQILLNGRQQLIATAPDILDVTVQLAQTDIAGVSLDAAGVKFNGFVDDFRFDGRLLAETTINSAEVGRAKIAKADIDLDVDLAVDVSTGDLTLGTTASDCLSLDQGRLALPDQDFSARYGEGIVCGGPAGPLVSVTRLNEAQLVRSFGNLVIDRFSAKMAETSLSGTLPSIRYAATYQPDAHITRVTGDAAGGNIVINEALRVRNMVGLLEGDLDREDMSGKVTLSKGRVEQVAEEIVMTPFGITGEGVLSNDVFDIEGVLYTIEGIRLGAATGSHDLARARGELTFVSDGIVFEPDGLQPTAFSPLFRGQIFDADGTVDTDIKVAWSEAGVSTMGDISFRRLTFGGPGLAVSQTRGISGDLSFRDLMPIETDGPQKITIEAFDLDALVLENGDVEFDVRGDDVLRVTRAEFPWYGGFLGAYEAEIPLVNPNGEALTQLEVRDVDLKAMLEDLEFEGLSGEGQIAGTLPIRLENGRAQLVDGTLFSKGPGIIRYSGRAGKAAAQAGEGAAIAFDVLRELRFSRLEATVNGPLDGDLDFELLFEGTSQIALNDPRVQERVDAPIRYRMNIKAPFMALLDQAKLSTDLCLQLKEVGSPACLGD